MENPLIAVIRSRLHSLQPLPTDVAPVIPPLSGIRAVLFDIYGTLLISASGDVGTNAQAENRAIAVTEALAAIGQSNDLGGASIVRRLDDEIQSAHQSARGSGIAFPEVEIREVWQRVAAEYKLLGGNDVDVGDLIERLAVEYELRVNPIWAMPGAIEIVRSCQDSRLTLGIISNAQFFTPLMWQAATGFSFEQAGFDPMMQYFSYVHRRAKPGFSLYQMAASSLRQRGILPTQVLYVGNDMLNDIAPAAAVGFRTALFAGDQRSLRLREDDASLERLSPGATVTELKQLAAVLRL